MTKRKVLDSTAFTRILVDQFETQITTIEDIKYNDIFFNRFDIPLIFRILLTLNSVLEGHD